MTGPRLVPVERSLVRLRLFGSMEATSFTGGNVLPRGQKARAILAYLVLTEDDVVPRLRLAQMLWSRRATTQAQGSLRQSLVELRKALADVGQPILTIKRVSVQLDRQFVWIDGLSVRADSGDAAESSAAFQASTLLETLADLDPVFDAWITTMRAAIAKRQNGAGAATALTRPPRSRAPSVAVTPFQALGADVTNAHIAPAFAHELATGLSRFRWITVRLAPTGDTGSTADYRVEGHISHSNAAGRMTIRLVDQTNKDAIVWSHGADFMDPIQPGAVAVLAERIVMRLDPEILAIETRKVIAGPPVSEAAYDLLLRAIPLIYAFDVKSWRAASALLDRAVALDPTFARAHAFAALCLVTGFAHGWVPMTAEAVRTMDRLTRAAIDHDPRDSLGLALAGHIRSFVHRDFTGAKALFKRAIEANPNCGFAWGYSAATFAYTADIEEARRRLAKAAALVQQEPFSSLFESMRGLISYFGGDWEEAITIGRAQLQKISGFTSLRKFIIASLCFLGRFDEAKAEHAILLGYEPEFSWPRHLQIYPFGRESDRVELQQALMRAGFLPGGSPA